MTLNSVFRSRAYLTPALLLLFLIAQFRDSTPGAIAVNCLTLLFLAFVWIWLFFGELRTKAVVVQVEGDLLNVSKYMGLGRTTELPLAGFEQIETCWVPNAYDAYEYLYLVKDGKKAVKISQFYHRNYAELKKELVARLGSPAEHKFSMGDELLDIFR